MVLSRAMFFFFDDPEGPNLLVVTVAAVIIYFLSLAAYFFRPLTATGLERLSLTVLIQIIIVTGLYFSLS